MILLYLIVALLVCAWLWRMFARSSVTTHAGGIVFKKQGNQLLYLLVTAKGNEEKWVLPKGNIDAGEIEEVTALREVKEESGITGKLIKKVGDVHGFKNIFKPIKTAFFLIKYVSETPCIENRKTQWLPLTAAIAKAGRPDQKKALRLLATSFSL